MRFLFLASIILLHAANVAAFAGPGAYGRMWYYYAYLVDTSGGRAATKIAVNCAQNMGTGGRPCTFNEFIKYIDLAPDRIKATKDYAVTNDREPDVERTANALLDKGLTGPYDNTKIRAEVNEKDGRGVAKVMTAITNFLEGTIGGASTEIKEGLKQATVATAKARMAASLDEIAEKLLDEHGIRLQRVQKPLFPNAPASATIEDVDVRATLANHPGITLNNLVSMIRDAQDSGHKGNIDAAKQGAARVHSACS